MTSTTLGPILAGALNTLRQSITAVDNADNPDAAFSSMKGTLNSTINILDAVVLSFNAIEQKTQTIESTVNQVNQANQMRQRKPMSESRCISNLKMLGSDKAEFKSWNEKLINAAAQSLGTPWRKNMRNLNKALDQDR